MGAIVDRTKDNLSRSDMAIVAARRMLLQAARTVADGGDSPAVDTSYYRSRPIEKVVPDGTFWREALLPEMHPEYEKQILCRTDVPLGQRNRPSASART